jgi:hypothetical protein
MTYSSMTISPAACILTVPSPPETTYSSILVTTHILHPTHLKARAGFGLASTKLGFIFGVKFYYSGLLGV